MTSLQWRGQRIRRPSLVQLAREAGHGRGWYRDSGESIARYATSRGLCPTYVSDVVAILSPRVSVSYNVTLTKRYIEMGSCEGMMQSRVQALQQYEASGVFHGPKVNAFSRALQGDVDSVVIDAWMIRLLGQQQRLTPKRYKGLVATVKGVATRLGWHPSETQAALWVGARKLCGYSDSYSPLKLGGEL